MVSPVKPLPRPMPAVGPDYVDRAPIKVIIRHAIPCTPERLFDIFADARSWQVWLGIDVAWTSPVGPRATRRIEMGPMRFDEQFMTWDHGREMSFYFSGASTRLFEAFFEDYQVEPDGTDGCTVTWTAAFGLRGPLRWVSPIVRAIFTANANRAYRKLAKYARTYDGQS